MLQSVDFYYFSPTEGQKKQDCLWLRRWQSM